MKMKILLIDDEFNEYHEMMEEILGCEIIYTGPTLRSKEGLEIIRQHSEADWILLDGSFKAHTNCMEIVPHLSPAEIQKVICFSGMAYDWIQPMKPYGVRHFPGKYLDKVTACIQCKCECEKI